jgi:NADP-dependent 3-hydroxy acid dehydrogenase YdfG
MLHFVAQRSGYPFAGVPMKTLREGTVPTVIACGVGAEKRLGTALCRRFAAEGYHVLVAGRAPHKVEHLATSIIGAGGSAETVQTN